MSTPSSSDQIIVKLFAGGSACMFISALLNPIDVVKARLQIQGQGSLLTGVHYHGLYDGLSTIAREEGIRGLMSGLTPSMMREASYSSLRMGLYDLFKGMLAPEGTQKDDFSLWQKILAGMASGALGSVIATPTDLVKLRFQTYSKHHPNPYPSTLSAFSHIYLTGGIRALYKGGAPTVIRAAILTSSQLSSYDQTKRALLHSGYFADNSLTHILASGVAGLVTATTTCPADVIKTRIMTDGQRGLRLYHNPLDCIIKTYRQEGIRAFFRGWLANWLRLGPHFIVSLPLTEFIRTSLGADSY
jgi:hypothetical protein